MTTKKKATSTTKPPATSKASKAKRDKVSKAPSVPPATGAHNKTLRMIREGQIRSMELRTHGSLVLNERFSISPNPDVFFLYVPKIACSYFKQCILEPTFGNLDNLEPSYYMKEWIKHDLVHALHFETCRINGYEVMRNLNSKVITFCRNPYDRFVSAYLSKLCHPHPKEYEGFQFYRRDILFYTMRNNRNCDILNAFKDGITIDQFAKYVHSRPVNEPDTHWSEQYLCNCADIIDMVDIIRYENFQADFERVWEKHIQTPFPGRNDFHRNETNRQTKLLTKETADLIYDVYARDFEIFGYSRDSWQDY